MIGDKWHILMQTYHQFTAKLKPSISMIWTFLKEVKKTVWSLVLQYIRTRPLISHPSPEWCGLLSSAYLSVFPKTSS